MSDPRARILARLRAAPPKGPPAGPLPPLPVPAGDDLVAMFRQAIGSFHGQVVETTEAGWPDDLRRVLIDKGARTLLHGPIAGRRLVEEWTPGQGPALVAYDRPVEELKPALLHDLDAGFTTTRGAIAETGSLVLWPTRDEPRLLSLLPPIHVALLDARRLVRSLAELLAAEGWAAGMPTNALLISGPSKTADIEQTLAYGVHGPKQLVVLLLS